MLAPDDLARIAEALAAACECARAMPPPPGRVQRKAGGDPVTEADARLEELLRGKLLRPGEGWLSEESADDGSRRRARRVWVVDPLDGTREYVQGLPEWCVSVGLVEDGVAIAGGIANPATGETFLGGEGLGLTLNGGPAAPSARAGLEGALVLASRSEVRRGEWRRFETAPFRVQPVGSVAYKLALVAAGRADATWTLCPKHDWDVAAGVALVRAAGGAVFTPSGAPPRFDRPSPKLDGLIASGPYLAGEVAGLLGVRLEGS